MERFDLDVIIEKTENFYSAFAEKVEGIYGAGSTIEQTKNSVIEATKIYFSYNKRINSFNKKNYKINFILDVKSFLCYYETIYSRAYLSQITNINERQLGHYIEGLHTPRRSNIKKIETVIYKLEEEYLK